MVIKEFNQKLNMLRFNIDSQKNKKNKKKWCLINFSLLKIFRLRGEGASSIGHGASIISWINKKNSTITKTVATIS